jgi:2-amino-4-hydroxy-6-hydroxymethyldihydropteridine diphosphokinase
MSVKRSLHRVYLALGTNLGDRAANIAEAVRRMADLGTVAAVSSLHETAPWGISEQPAFLNAACLLLTRLAPHDLLVALKRIEHEMGRMPTVRNGPRLIDIDILFYDNLILALPGLTIPHARLHERSFVLLPLLDIAPDLVHPVLKQTVREMAQALDSTPQATQESDEHVS